MDFKYFQAQNQKIAISQVTSVSENELNGIRDKMLDYMEDYLKTSGLSMLFAMLTNIIEEKTELLYVGGAQRIWCIPHSARNAGSIRSCCRVLSAAKSRW